jgi:RNA polymerase sigma-70 factor (TIGR02960 family)
MVDSELRAARAGDELAFRALVEPHQRELHVHCYRMLGSVDDADDLLQETLLAAWRGLGAFAGRSSLRTWLYRIATTRCLNMIRDSRRRPPLAPAPPFDPPTPSSRFEAPWLQPYPDALIEHDDPSSRALAREGIELAFVTALQTLPPRQTAALVLCDVVGFSLAEVAAILDGTPTTIKGLLQRARAAMPTAVSAPTATAETQLAHEFATAFEADDIERVVALLTDEAWLAMPPATERYDGPAAIATFLRASALGRPGDGYILLPTRAGGHPAFGCYLQTRARGLLVLIPNVEGTAVIGIARFLDDRLHRRFDLPDAIAPSDHPLSGPLSAQ